MGRFRLEPFPTIGEKPQSQDLGRNPSKPLCVGGGGGQRGGRVVVWLGDLKKVTFFF